MDFLVIVDKKLLDRDNCVCSMLATRISADRSREPIIVGVVESSGEHGFFLYTCKTIPTCKSDDIVLDATIPINDDFKLTIASQAIGGNQATGNIPLKIDTPFFTLLLELPNGDAAKLLLAELKRTRQVYSQNASFGITSDFKWLEKYSNSPEDKSNPFLMEIFDPLAPKLEKEDWRLDLIKQLNVGKNAPVVKDESMMKHSVSVDRMSDSGSYHDSLQVAESNDPLRRSYEHSIDQLGMAVTNDTVTNRRDDLIRHIMKQREDAYTDIKTYRLFCGTWNTNGQSASASLKAWLSPQEDDIPPDIYAIGFQELDLSKNAYIFSESPKEAEWYGRVRHSLHHKAKYKKVKLIRLVGIMLVVFIRVELTEHLFDVMWDTVGTGILGMMGNKGGVGIRLLFHDTTICFVNTHLAAHVEEYDRRNQDFRDISSKMAFNRGRNQADHMITDHDMVFWIGDLNYRLSDIDSDRAKLMIEKGQLTDLMNYDQLCRQIVMKKVFLDYLEGRVNFVPTYKYDTGTDKWDTSEKCRTPAWCDRILWRGQNIRQIKYRSHMECRLSDHKPVSALFDIGVKVINKKQYRTVYEDIMKQLDKMENEYLPQVALNSMEVRFENVKFVEPQFEIITITNTGQGPVQFEFINKPNDVSFCKPWLTITPSKGIIDVGQRLEVQLDAYVDSQTASSLNTGDERIEDILVLHLEGGKDIFITIVGCYIPSCFGSSLLTLVNMFNPIREVPVAEVNELAKRGEVSSDRPLDVPKELYWLTDHLYKYGMRQERLFQQPGRPSEIQEIRDCLDQGTPQDIAGQIHSVAEALLVFLEALPDPVIPYAAYTRCLDAYSNFNTCKQVLKDIPQCHRSVFKYICAFLRELLRFSSENNLDAKSVTLLFSGLLLRPPPVTGAGIGSARRISTREDDTKRSAFLYHFLVNSYDE